MKKFYKLMSVLLAVLMVASAVSIGGILAYHLPGEEKATLGGNNIVISEQEKEDEEAKAENDTPEKEEKNDQLLPMEERNPVPDDKIITPAGNGSVSAGNMGSDVPKIPEMPEKDDKSEFFDDDNSIKVPFDKIYPEEFEEGVFEYDDETLMIKVKSLNEKRENELKEAGVLKLEEMMNLGDAVWYVAYIEKDADITEVMEEVRELDFIKVAEYNFKYETATVLENTESAPAEESAEITAVLETAETASTVASGPCGNNAKWVLDSNGTFTVSGTGSTWNSVYDYDDTGFGIYSRDWYNYVDQIKKVVVEEGITSIGSGLFYDFKNVTEAPVIASTVTEIRELAFSGWYNCDADLALPEGLVTIGGDAFSCSAFSGELVIPKTVETIGMAAFRCCDFEGDIVIPEGIRTITKLAFSGCHSFNGTIVFPDSVTKIEAAAFSGCDGFSGSLIIPETIAYLGPETFRGCGFDRYIFEGNAPEILEDEFYYSNIFNEENDVIIYNPEKSGWILSGKRWSGALAKTENDYFVSGDCSYPYDDASSVEWGITYGGKLVISGTGIMDNYSTTYENSKTTTDAPWSDYLDQFDSLEIKEGVTYIGYYAFYGCNNLKGDLRLPESLIGIKESAFRECSGFDGKLYLPKNLKTLAGGAFNGCSGFTGDIIIPDGVTQIGGDAFYQCSGFDGKLVLSCNLKNICDLAFADCTGLSGEVVIPEAVTRIGNSFMNCAINEYYFEGNAPMVNDITKTNWNSFDAEDIIYYPAGNETWEIVDGKWNGYTAFAYDANSVENNPKYADQWYLKNAKIKEAWDYLKENDLPMAGEGTIVAVIDTGVDYDHIDLKSNMWKNVNEIPDNGIDDDENGYIDDYYGIDIVHGSGNGDDDHGHGTHVAGIIAAANNKEGTVGVAYNAKIMAVKAGQASGYFLQSDIAKAIYYAWQNGADVINMSIGGSTSSIAVQDALAAAYTDCVLVAAAGNNGVPCEPSPYWNGPVMPSYPGALSYVLGVMSINPANIESGFTNWDVYIQSGKDYEVYAPGEQLWSTLPNDKYAAWSGTSMAAPVVSGVAAILRSAYTDRDTYPTKFIYGQLASATETPAYCGNPNHGPHYVPEVVDAYMGLTAFPKPLVYVNDYYIFDSVEFSDKNNGDGVIDAGETFALGFVLRNQWGMSKNTKVTIDSISIGGVANRYVTIDGGTSSTRDYGSVGTYSDKDAGKIYEDDMFVGWENPFMITVAEDCPNDYILPIYYTVTFENGLDETDETVYQTGSTEDSKSGIEIGVRRGTLVPNDISEDMTLTADKLWIVPYSVLIREGVTVTVEAGTNIQFYCSSPDDPYAETGIPYIEVAGTLLFEGTEENHIKLFPSELYYDFIVEISENVNSGYVEMKYCDWTNPNIGYNISYAEGCEFNRNTEKLYVLAKGTNEVLIQWYNNIYVREAKNCIFYKFKNYDNSTALYLYDDRFAYSNFDNCTFVDSDVVLTNINITNCTFIGCKGCYQFNKTEAINGRLETNPNIGTDVIYYFDQFAPEYGEKLIEFMGASLFCFDDEQDKNLSEMVYNPFGLYIGLKQTKKGEYSWVNGTKVEDFVLDMIVEGKEEYGILYEEKIYFDYSYLCEAHNAWFMVSVPEGSKYYDELKSTNENKIDDMFNEINKDYMASEDFGLIKNNVVINRVSSENKSEWFTLNAPNDDTHKMIYNFSGNYWGTTNPELIEKQIYDFDDDISLAQITPGNFLTEAPENVWPFVTKAGTIVDGKEFPIVGNEEVTFFVEFNRDMDTTIPLRVRFGSYYPYADYEVPGEFVSPRRWEGTMTLTTLIENGTQYFNISNGKAADSFQKLYDDWGRFTFEIDTTEALAMNLQAEATDEGIKLNWFQDDFDTLAGYNVYRSTSEDGFYQKLNDTVIPVDVKEFFDDEVEPGTLYYYNFTVVKTDLTESVPSGKQVIMSKDTMLPDVYHTPVYNAFTGNKVTISATVTDNLRIDSVKLYYRIAGTEEWKSVNMGRTNDKFFYSIDQSFVTTAGIEYYIEAFDGTGYAYKGTAEEPYFITVQLAVSDNDKGDVDGDGVITNRDALILLQGINDLYNLSAEEFARADINEDGELNAVEALRILQYVSGKITSVLF